MGLFDKKDKTSNKIYMKSDKDLYEKLLLGRILNCRDLDTHGIVYHKFLLQDKIIQLETKMNNFILKPGGFDPTVINNTPNNKSEYYFDWYVCEYEEDNLIVGKKDLLCSIINKLTKEELIFISTYGKSVV